MVASLEREAIQHHVIPCILRGKVHSEMVFRFCLVCAIGFGEGLHVRCLGLCPVTRQLIACSISFFGKQIVSDTLVELVERRDFWLHGILETFMKQGQKMIDERH